jgi:2-haloacid dehalogenase
MSDPVSDPPPDRIQRPTLLIFDVNETLSDMTPLRHRFADVGAPTHLTGTWFAGLLRDGFALTVVGLNPRFADLATEGLRLSLGGLELDRTVDQAVAHIMDGFAALDVHPDVTGGLSALTELGIRLVTLSNGSASIAERLLSSAGLDSHFERFLSVEEAGIWKPASAAYAYALAECNVEPADAMLVAAHPWDTDGAQRAGLSSAWINRTGAAFPNYFQPPTLEVDSLPQLADRLR